MRASDVRTLKEDLGLGKPEILAAPLFGKAQEFRFFTAAPIRLLLDIFTTLLLKP